jgi:hypothetical protein
MADAVQSGSNRNNGTIEAHHDGDCSITISFYRHKDLATFGSYWSELQRSLLRERIVPTSYGATRLDKANWKQFRIRRRASPFMKQDRNSPGDLVHRILCADRNSNPSNNL